MPKPSIFALHKQHKPAGQTHRYHHIYAARYGIQHQYQTTPEEQVIPDQLLTPRCNAQQCIERCQTAKCYQGISPALNSQLIDYLHAGVDKYRDKRRPTAQAFPANLENQHQTPQGRQIGNPPQRNHRIPEKTKQCRQHGITDMIIRQGPMDCCIDRSPAYKVIIGIQLIIPWCQRKHPPAIITCHKNEKQNKHRSLFIKFTSLTALFHNTIKSSLQEDLPSVCSPPAYTPLT